MRFFKAIISAAVVLFILSCVTDQPAVREIPEYNESLLVRIDKFFETGKPEMVIQLCRGVEDSRIKSQNERAINEIEKKLDSALEADDYPAAVEIIKSMKAAGLDVDTDEYELYVKEVILRINNDDITPALAIFQNQIINKNIKVKLTEDEAGTLLDAAIKNKSKVIIKYIFDNFPRNVLERTEEIKEIAENTPDKEELISGTVTIWVNRGIKIEKGVGYPDRVIGSGFYIDPRGFILTNYHVIASEVDSEYEGYSRLYIKYDPNEEKIPARVIGWDASLDIALLKVEYNPEYFYTFPQQKVFRPGEKIYAIGSPGGLENTITSGIISASGNRRLLPVGDTIQVDVPINAGNSGGPVVDEYGNLVGVVFAGIEQFEGVNFIIPVKWILKSLPELYEEGRNRQSWLGMTVHEDNTGLEIMYLMPGTSGFNSEIKPRDEIISIDGIAVKKITEAQEIIQDKKPGTLINIMVRENEELKNVLLIVEEREDMPMRKALDLDSRKNLLTPFLGMAVDKGDEKLLGQQYIVKKVYRGTSADETGLSVDDPFSIVSWNVDDENDVLIIGIRIKKRKAGFLETVIQMGNYIDINNTI